jgi:hypothetical protein
MIMIYYMNRFNGWLTQSTGEEVRGWRWLLAAAGITPFFFFSIIIEDYD